MTDCVSCSGCHFLMKGSESPSGESWCGWMGGTPEPDNPARCRPVARQVSALPEGLVIARTGRVVPIERLSDEMEIFTEVTGRPD